MGFQDIFSGLRPGQPGLRPLVYTQIASDMANTPIYGPNIDIFLFWNIYYKEWFNKIYFYIGSGQKRLGFRLGLIEVASEPIY